MDVSVGILGSTPGGYPTITVTVGDSTVVLPWAAWEAIVHRASHRFVEWAYSHPSAYRAYLDAIDRGFYAELRDAGWSAPVC